MASRIRRLGPYWSFIDRPVETDARAGRNHSNRLVRELAHDVRHPVGRVTGLVLDPAAQDSGQAWSHAGDRGIVAETADREQPRRNRLPQQRAVAGDHRLLLQRKPHVRRVRANRFAEESRRGHADDRERVTFHDERRSEERRVRPVDALPQAMAEHDDRRCRGPVVIRREQATAEGADAERGEIRSAGILRAHGPAGLVRALTPDAQQRAAPVERGDVVELRRSRLQSLVQRERKQSPGTVAARGDGVVPVADPVQPRRVRHGQRPEHDAVDEREDGGGPADSERQHADRRETEPGRPPQRAEHVGEASDQRIEPVPAPDGKHVAAAVFDLIVVSSHRSTLSATTRLIDTCTAIRYTH